MKPQPKPRKDNQPTVNKVVVKKAVIKQPSKPVSKNPQLGSGILHPAYSQEEPSQFKSPTKLPYDGWNPLVHGITQSMLQKFICDRDRFHKSTVLRYRETTRKEAMNYGSIFHKLIEAAAKLPHFSQDQLIAKTVDFFRNQSKDDIGEILCQTAVVQYMHYRRWAAERPSIKYIDAEPVFKEMYELPPLAYNPCNGISISIPPGIVFPLRGRIDGVIDVAGSMWIEENKTKGNVNKQQLAQTICSNIQVMFYAVCSQLKYGRPCYGVVYNVIRKPALRRGIKESRFDYIQRIDMDIESRPDEYFTRLTVEFTPEQILRWVREELNPLLYHVYLWWKSIEQNPINPWVDLDGNVNPFHGRKSFGIYDAMTLSKGDFYELIVNNRMTNIELSENLFPELEDDEE
jgi:hypothetical protein